MTFKLKRCLTSDGSIKDSSVDLTRSGKLDDDDEDGDCCEDEEFGKNFLINILKKKVVRRAKIKNQKKFLTFRFGFH